MTRKLVVVIIAGAGLVGAVAVWMGVVLTERADLLQMLRRTEETLHAEREAAERSAIRCSEDLRMLQAQDEDARQILAEQHASAMRAVTGEALKVQIDLLRHGFRLVAPASRPGQADNRR